MKRLLILLFLLTSCNNNSSSSLSILINESSKDYKDYSEYYIELNEMYNIDNEEYVIYFYSNTCPACYDMKDNLFNYLDYSNKILGHTTIGMDEIEKSYYMYVCPNCNSKITYSEQCVIAKEQRKRREKRRKERFC